jgi:hypothetical protein
VFQSTGVPAVAELQRISAAVASGLSARVDRPLAAADKKGCSKEKSGHFQGARTYLLSSFHIRTWSALAENAYTAAWKVTDMLDEKKSTND